MSRVKTMLTSINDKSRSLEARLTAASEVYRLFCDDDWQTVEQANAADASASLIKLLSEATSSTTGALTDLAANAIVALLKEGGADVAWSAFTAGAVPLFTMAAADDTLKPSVRLRLTWALGYLIKVVGQKAVAEARCANGVHVLIQLVTTTDAQPDLLGRGVWTLRMLAEVGGVDVASEARNAGALQVLATALEQPGLQEWISTYIKEAIQIIAQEAKTRDALPPLAMKPNAITPRGFGSQTPRSAASGTTRPHAASARNAAATPRNWGPQVAATSSEARSAARSYEVVKRRTPRTPR